MSYRVGTGFDVHGVNRYLMGMCLGGVIVEDVYALHGDSDADVVLHALSDALLSTVVSMDIGAFLGGYKERNSVNIFEKTALYVSLRGARVENCSITLIAATDIITVSKYRDKITKNLEFLLKSSVTLTSSSGNGMIEAAKSGVICYATVLVKMLDD